MKISLIFTGKTKLDWVSSGIREYSEKLKHYISLQIRELHTGKITGKNIEKVTKQKEGELILNSIKNEDFLILLDERGKIYSSTEFADFLEKEAVQGIKSIVFVVGGAYGFDQSVYNRSNLLISISKMTFSHQIIRIIFMEQLYRAFTIIRGESYHHG